MNRGRFGSRVDTSTFAGRLLRIGLMRSPSSSPGASKRIYARARPRLPRLPRDSSTRSFAH
jgi:hypothetical protein